MVFVFMIGNNLSSIMSRPIIIPLPKPISIPAPPPPPPLPLPPTLRMHAPSVTIKKLNWKIILPHQLSKDSVWIKCDQNQPLSDEIYAKLSKNFATKPAKKIISATKSNISVQVIDMKNAQNILILLRTQCKHLSYEEIKKFILRCDTTMLGLDFINGLIKSLPEAHQTQLRKLKSDGVQLIDVEEFLGSLCDINRLLPRFHCMKFKMCFDDLVQKLESDIKAIMVCCKEVVACQKLHKILHLILSIGNFMNSGSCIGQATAFELSILANLNDVKGTDNQRTILLSIIEVIEETQPDLLTFVDELIHLHEATHVNTSEVDEAIKEMDGMLDFIRIELESANETHPAPDDEFVDVMSSFASRSHEKLLELITMNKHMQIRCIQVADFFAFDAKKYQINQCFKDIVTFKDLFTQKSTEIAKRREAEKVAAKRQFQKSTGRQEIKNCSVVCREFSICLNRLSPKGLYLRCCVPVSSKQINYS